MIGNRLDRYIGSTVLISTVIITFIIICLASLFAFIDQLTDLKNNYGILQAIQFTALTAPRRLYDILPMATLVGSLIGLGTLASRSELTVMRAAGMSTGRIVFAVIKPIFIVMVLSVFLGEYVVPYTETRAQANKELAISYDINEEYIEQNVLEGIWLRQGHEYIRINSVQPNGLLIGVTRYYKQDQKLQYSGFAKKASFKNNQWTLEDATLTCFHNDTIEVKRFPSLKWITPEPNCGLSNDQLSEPVHITPSLLSTISSNPNNLSLSGSWYYIHYLEKQGLNNNKYWLAFWEKLLQPLKTLALVLLAISFIFGPLRTVTMGQRIFTGVVIGFIFKIVQDLLAPASLVFNFPPLLAALLPIIICLLAGVYLLRRQR